MPPSKKAKGLNVPSLYTECSSEAVLGAVEQYLKNKTATTDAEKDAIKVALSNCKKTRKQVAAYEDQSRGVMLTFFPLGDK